MKILNIFCDASIVLDRLDMNNTIGCAGNICVDGDNIIDRTSTILYSTTNNEAEITAIQGGVHAAYKYKDKYDIINIFSDSKICVYGLKHWSMNWKIIDNTFYGSSNMPVANQAIFINIINFILNNRMDYINLYHQKGHVTNTESSLNNASNVFTQSNGIILDLDSIMYISKYNDIIDKMTKSELEGLNNDKSKKRVYPIKFDISRIPITTEYNAIINNNRPIKI